jgi:hypothetical protein
LQDIREKLKGVQQQFEELLLRECQVTPGFEEFKQLIQKGANPNSLADSRFSSSLQLGAYYGKVELVQFLLKEGIKDGPGMITISDHIHNSNDLKVAILKWHSNLHRQGAMSPWYNSF